MVKVLSNPSRRPILLTIYCEELYEAIRGLFIYSLSGRVGRLSLPQLGKSHPRTTTFFVCAPLTVLAQSFNDSFYLNLPQAPQPYRQKAVRIVQEFVKAKSISGHQTLQLMRRPYGVKGSVYVVTLPAFQRYLEDGPDAAERRIYFIVITKSKPYVSQTGTTSSLLFGGVEGFCAL
ncbi:hypothetical protein KY289_008651 [Solanum tuberosum]|nr:hypothetical protein KY289_008651 [Solanum tuberosum]